MTPEVILEPGRPTATVQSVREAISAMVRVSADELADNLGNIVVTTSAQVLSGVKPVMEDEAFRKWFAGSVMVDGDGEPMVMYHGSYRDFTEFDRLASVGWRQRSVDTVGSWFSSAPGERGAGMYASGVGAAIYPVYINIKRPKHYDSFGELLAAMHEAEGRDPSAQASRNIGSAEGLRQLLKLQGYDGIALARTNVEELTGELSEAREAVRRAKDEEYAAPKGERPIYTAKRERLEETVRRLEAEWRVCGGSTEFDGQTVVIAFESEQIKSAIGNRGTYDAGVADIRHSLGAAGASSLVALRANAVAAQASYKDFEREVAAGKEPDADTYFQLSTAVGDAEAAFAAALSELPDSDFSLKASTADGRQLLLNRSAQRAGYYQLTRFAKDGAPWGDTQYITKKKSVAEFLDEADVSTVVDFGGALARADAFNLWFGESKVVDGDGRPLVVYHGTGADFARFGTGRGAIYFTDDAEVASVYADHAEAEDVDGEDIACPNVIPAYLAMQNPLVLDEAWAKGNLDLDGERDWTTLDNVLYQAESDGHDGVILRGVVDFAGLDGDVRLVRPYDQYIVFHPEQIKSAIGYRGTFDPKNPDVRYSISPQEGFEGGGGPVVPSAPDAEAFREWFGNSRVVDDAGVPLVVYHGTGTSFNAFDTNRIGANFGLDEAGFFFSTDYETAERYAENAARKLTRAGQDGTERVVAVHLSLQNPWIINVDTDEMSAVAHFEGGKGQFNRGSSYILQYAQESGFDGVIIQDKRGLSKYDALVIAFKPEQIKSADNNRGTYDPRDPDIRHSLAAGAAGLDPRAQAFHDVATNTTVFLADRIPAGKEASVFLHETVHRHGRQALPEGRWGALVGQVKAWDQAGLQTPERAIHDAAAARVATAGVAGAVADEELFAYAVEEAVAMGIEPTAAAVEGSAEAWLQVVVESIQRVTDKLLGNDLQELGGQDLVDLAYALAQLDSPEHGLDVRRALAVERAAAGQEIEPAVNDISEEVASYER